MRSFIQLTIAYCALVVVLIAGIAGLAQLKFTSFLSESVHERLEIITATLAQEFGATIDLGLSLPEVANGGAILARALNRDPDIHSIAVFDLEGVVLHAVGGGTGQRLNDEAFDAFSLANTVAATSGRWGTENEEWIGTGITLQGSFGRPAGGILIEYPKTEIREQSQWMAGSLIRGGSWVAAAMCAAMFGIVGVFRSQLARSQLARSEAGSKNGSSRVP